MSKRKVMVVVGVMVACVALFLSWSKTTGSKDESESRAQTAGSAMAKRATSKRRTGPALHPLKHSGLVSGQVQSPDAQGIAGAQVCAVSWGDAITGEDTLMPNCVLADREGRFSFPSLWAAKHSLEATARGYLPSSDVIGVERDDEGRIALELEEGQSRDDIVIMLEPGGVELVGQVHDIGGGPIAGAWVEMHPTNASGRPLPEASARALSNEEGEVRLWLGEGPYQVEASAEGYVAYNSYLTVPGMELSVALEPGSTLRGRVVLGDGEQPAAYARVDARAQRGRAFSARADADGNFSISRMPAGRYQVSARSDEGYGRAQRSYRLALGQDVDDVTIALLPGRRIAGRVVVGEDKRPCHGAEGQLWSRGGGGARLEAGDEPGEVVAENVAPGRYSLWIDCESGRSERFENTVDVGEEDLLDQEWTMADALSVVVRVRDEEGQPVAKAALRLSIKDDPLGTGAWGRSNQQGVATLKGAALGTATLSVQADGLLLEEGPMEVEITEPDQELSVQLSRGGEIVGMVEARRGTLPKGLWVVASKTGQERFMPMDGASAMVRDDGSFRFTGLAGSYEFKVQRSRWDFDPFDTAKRERYEVEPGKVTEVRLSIEGNVGSVRGQVVDSQGQPVGDAFIRVVQDKGEERAFISQWELRGGFFSKDATLSDPDGRFSVHQLPEGPYMLRAYRRGGGEAIERGVLDGAEVKLTIVDTGAIRGRVLGSSGSPVTSFTIHCGDDKSGVERHEKIQSPAGEFEIDELPPGSYRLTVEGSEGSATSELLVLQAEEEKNGVELRLEAAGTLTGRIVAFDTGEPVAGMTVSAHRATENMRSVGMPDRAITGEDGRFELERVPAGALRLSGFHPGVRGDADEWGPVAASAEMDPGGKVDLGDLKVGRLSVSYQEAGDLGFTPKRDKGPMSIEELVVGEVDPKGPAERAGLQPDDVIVAINGTSIADGQAYLAYTLLVVAPGTTLALVLADGRELSLTAGPPKQRDEL